MPVPKMTAEQKELFNALTDFKQKVAINSLAGMTPSEAHKKANGKCKHEDNRRKLANEILTHPDVVAFMNAMKEVAVTNAIMSRERMMEILSKVADVSVKDLESLGAGVLTELKGGFDVKLKAMRQLSDLAGYDAPAKTELSGTVQSVQLSREDYASVRAEMLKEDDC